MKAVKELVTLLKITLAAAVLIAGTVGYLKWSTHRKNSKEIIYRLRELHDQTNGVVREMIEDAKRGRSDPFTVRMGALEYATAAQKELNTAKRTEAGAERVEEAQRNLDVALANHREAEAFYAHYNAPAPAHDMKRSDAELEARISGRLR